MSEVKSYAKVGEAVIEISRDEKGNLVAKEVNKKEVAEAHLLGLTEHFNENLVSKTIESAYTELLQSFKSNIKSNVLKAMGFSEDRWSNGKWEVDHCNGRMSDVGRVVEDQVRQAIMQATRDAIPLDESTNAMIEKAIKRDFKDRMEYRVRDYVGTQADKMIKERVNKFFEEAAGPMVDAMVQESLSKMIKSKIKKGNDNESI